jgi:hypothetical protein
MIRFARAGFFLTSVVALAADAPQVLLTTELPRAGC